jgi:hypothetical protein
VDARLAATSPGAALQDPDQPQLFYTHSRVARRDRIGRVMLGGDAAHACSPIQGHGMNTGMQDAFNLGWKLALVATGAAPETLLDSYEPERRPLAQAIADSGDEAEARVLQRDPTARQEMVKFLATPEGRGAAAMAESELDFGYEQSPIVAPRARAASGTKVGFRVGDAGPLEGQGRSRRLHEILGTPACTLLLLLGEADRAALPEGLALASAAAERYRPHLRAYVVTRNTLDGPDDLLCDPTGSLHARLGVDRPCLCLIRPDGHLGLCAEPPSLEALQTHLDGIFRFAD